MKNSMKEISVIIAVTFFSVLIMVFSFNIKLYIGYINEKTQNNKNYLDEDKTYNKSIEESLLSKESDQISKEDKNEDINTKENEKETLISENSNNSREYYIDDINKSDLDEGVSIAKDEEDVVVNKNGVQSIFKTDKNNIINKISSSDKLKIIKMANSLSVNDYRNLINNIKRSDEVLAAMDIFQLLKNKLSDKQYKELIAILDPYIDIKMIENKINEK